MSIPFKCSICCDTYSDDAEHDAFALVTPCGHLFHLLCLQKSLCTWGSNCPGTNCLTQVTPQNIFEVKDLGHPKPAPKILHPQLIEEAREPDYTLKMITIGSTGVGKSSLMSRYCDDSFCENNMPTYGVDYKVKHLLLNLKNIRIQIWDTSGQERYRAIAQAYLRDVDGVLLVYDVTEMRSFIAIDAWYQYLIEEGLENVETILIGNKTDMEVLKVVRSTAGLATAKQFGIPFFETSAKENLNIDAAFRKLVGNILMSEHFQQKQIEKAMRKQRIQLQVDRSNNTNDTNKKKKGCCY